MKTKTQIRNQIAKMQEWKRKAIQFGKEEGLPRSSYGGALQRTDAFILGLQWALGYKLGETQYWCTRCRLFHKGQTCPECGSDKLAW